MRGDELTTIDEIAPTATDRVPAVRRPRRSPLGLVTAAVRRPSTVALLSYLTLAVVVFRGGWGSGATHNIGGPGDPIAGMWALRWTPYALVHGHNPLFTDHLNFPFGVNLMWNAPIMLHSILLWPVTATAGPIAAYNVLVTLNVALSAWCAYLAFRTFVASRPAAFAGGLIYGFSPYMMAQSLDHPTLTAAYIPPLLLLVLHEILVGQRRSALRMGALLGLLAATQLFIAEEMLACQALVAGLGLLVLVVMHPRSVARRARHALVAVGSALGVFLLATSWALWLQFFGPQRITGGSVQPPNFFVSDLANFVVPTKVQQLAPGWAVAMTGRWSGNLSEWDAYIGVPLLLAVVYVVVRCWSRPVVRTAAVLGLLTAVLSLGPNLHVNGHDTSIPLPWRAIAPLPLLGHILPTRLMVFAFLMIALLAAVLVDHILSAPSGRRRLIGAAAGVAVVVTLLPTLSYPSTRVAAPRFFTDGSARIIPEGSTALVAPMQQLFPADPMLWQAEADMRFRMPQGYFFAPDEQGRPRYGAPFSATSLSMYLIQQRGEEPEVIPELRSIIARDFDEREIQTVIVGPMKHQQKMVRFFSALFDAGPERFGDVYVWQRAHRLLR